MELFCYNYQMDYKLTKLKNGVQVLTVPMPSFESATITVWVKTGSRFENPRVNGISHFLEHMVFKGGKKYSSAKAVSEAIDGLGAENDAGTSKEWTNFWIKTASINLEKAFDILADVTLNPLLLDKEIDRERNVIYEEIAMYEDTPLMDIPEKFESLIYAGTSLSWQIAGDKKSLSNINHDEFEIYRKEKYHAENILICVAGAFDENKVDELTKKYFSAVTSGPKKEENDLVLLPKTTEERVLLKTKNNSDQAQLMLGFLTKGKGYEGRYAQAVLSSILGGGMSSRLFTEVREKRGFAYSVYANTERYIGVGSFYVRAGVNVGKIDEAIKVVLNELYGMADKKKKISKKEFEKAKSYLKGKLALSLEDSQSVGDFLVDQVLFDLEIKTPKDIYKKLDKVTIDDVYSEAEKLFSPNGCNLAVIGPYKNREKFVQLLR